MSCRVKSFYVVRSALLLCLSKNKEPSTIKKQCWFNGRETVYLPIFQKAQPFFLGVLQGLFIVLNWHHFKARGAYETEEKNTWQGPRNKGMVTIRLTHEKFVILGTFQPDPAQSCGRLKAPSGCWGINHQNKNKIKWLNRHFINDMPWRDYIYCRFKLSAAKF